MLTLSPRIFYSNGSPTSQLCDGGARAHGSKRDSCTHAPSTQLYNAPAIMTMLLCNVIAENYVVATMTVFSFQRILVFMIHDSVSILTTAF